MYSSTDVGHAPAWGCQEACVAMHPCLCFLVIFLLFRSFLNRPVLRVSRALFILPLRDHQ